VPDLRLLRIEDAGHYPMQTHAEQVTRARREFFSLRSRCRTGVSRTPLLRRPAVTARRSITRAMSAAAWDVLIACLGQLRLAPSGHVVGIDMSVALRLLDGDLGFGR
jgi:hypothetical protein